ncbi:MAG: ABC transporter permease subunit [Deltaproteobacteria bacterium]|nr:ABC transporter permease subunit [Deltaproteobacteria bacterium]
MNRIRTIARREFTAYFRSPIAYIYLVAFLVLTHWLFFRAFFLIGEADLRSFFLLMPWIYLFFIPAVAMGKWAEERKTGTIEFLFTLPVRDGEIVCAKFLAGLGLVAVAVAGTAALPLTAAWLGDPDWGPLIGGYCGLLFMGGAYLAIGLAVSSVTENQIVAFICAVVACFILLVIGEPVVTTNVPAALAPLLQSLGLSAHFASIGRGVIDSRDLIYYLSVIGLFLWWNYRIIRRRR